MPTNLDAIKAARRLGVSEGLAWGFARGGPSLTRAALDVHLIAIGRDDGLDRGKVEWFLLFVLSGGHVASWVVGG
jgi:hypothetical protein